MDLSLQIMNKEDTIASILNFQTNNTSNYWRNKLFAVYTFLDEVQCSNLKWEDKRQYLTFELSRFYDKIKPNLQNKLIESQKIWMKNKRAINNIYSRVFDIDCESILNDMVAEISLNPICPRNLNKKSFSVFWGADNNNFLKTTLHEMIHFVWFYVWHQHFSDDIEEYESPHIKWILSEMVIDTFIKNTEIGNLYPKLYKQQPAYKYFYNMKIKNVPILNMLAKIKKKSANIENFMEIAYEYCLENEYNIRKQIL